MYTVHIGSALTVQFPAKFQDGSVSGVSYHVLALLMSDLNFTVSLSMPEDKQFGAFDPVRQEWTGVIGMLANNNSSPGVG